MLLAYALLPAVDAIVRVRDRRGRHLPRGAVAAGVMLVLVALVGWSVALAVPRLVAEAGHFVVQAPDVVDRIVRGLHLYAAERGFSAWMDPAIESIRDDAAGVFQTLGTTLGHGAGRVFGGLGHVLTILLLPLLAFYLLADSEGVQTSALRFVPEDAGLELTRLGGAVDRALRSYVRGQAIVCVVMGAAVAIGLTLAHHPAALLLGLLAGAAELVPYVGFLLTATAIGLSGSSVSALQAALGLAVYVCLNWATGAFMTPRVMGRYLKMHPFVVTVSVLAGALLLGAPGALLALPAAAVIQAVIGELAPATIHPARAESHGVVNPREDRP